MIELVKKESYMTQQQENLSAFIDGELDVTNDQLITEIQHDEELRAKWQRYHMIRDGLRGELGQSTNFDIAASVAQAIQDEPAIVAPKKRMRDLPVIGSVVPLFKQSGQFLVAASVAAVVILGVQNYNHQDVAEPFSTAPPISGRPQGGLTPVSLEQTRTVQRNDMAALLEQRRMINALIADHQNQLKMMQKQGSAQTQNVEQDAASQKDLEQPQQP